MNNDYTEYQLPLSESFYSIQGEGITTGYPSVFLRLAGCNLMCGGQGTQFDKQLHNGATWRCDTIEVWMTAQLKSFEDTLDEESKEALRNGAHLIITGGEPLMNEGKLKHYIKWVRQTFNPNCYVEIETNGTITPSTEFQELISQWNCSPKLSNSGNDYQVRYKRDTLKVLNTLNTQFKFVLSVAEDYNEIMEYFRDICDHDKIWLMPSGENQTLLNESKQIVAELAKKHYHKFTNRLHIEIWNRKTGV